jgi:Ni,Fe-hydrogenase I cytochrome b subunit
MVLNLNEIRINALTVLPNQQQKFLYYLNMNTQTSRFSVYYKFSSLFVVYVVCKIYWRCFQNVSDEELLWKTFFRNTYLLSMKKQIHEIVVINK